MNRLEQNRSRLSGAARGALVSAVDAALGLPIYPAPFDGHEMTLVEGVNGSLIGWDPEAIAARLEADIEDGLLSATSGVTGKGIGDMEFRDQIRSVYRDLLASPR